MLLFAFYLAMVILGGISIYIYDMGFLLIVAYSIFVVVPVMWIKPALSKNFMKVSAIGTGLMSLMLYGWSISKFGNETSLYYAIVSTCVVAMEVVHSVLMVGQSLKRQERLVDASLPVNNIMQHQDVIDNVNRVQKKDLGVLGIISLCICIYILLAAVENMYNKEVTAHLIVLVIIKVIVSRMVMSIYEKGCRSINDQIERNSTTYGEVEE